jgi:hypothetical protein
VKYVNGISNWQASDFSVERVFRSFVPAACHPAGLRSDRRLIDLVISGRDDGKHVPKEALVGCARPLVFTFSDQGAEEILRRVTREELKPGHALPPQRELARQLDVGLSIIHEAI